MKLHTILALSLVLPLASSCDSSDVDAAAKKAQDAVADLGDISLDDIKNTLSVEQIQEVASGAMTKMSDAFKNIQSSEDVQKLAEKADPMLNKLEAMASKLGKSLPGGDDLKAAMDSVAKQFSSDGEVMKVLQPLIDRIEALFA